MSPELDDQGLRELDVRVGFGLLASEDQVGPLLSMSRRVDVDAGQVLYAANDPVTTLFQVVTGSVEVTAPERPPWNVADRGVIGMIDFAAGRVHARTAIATTPTQLLELDASEYRDYLEDNYEIAPRILAQLSGRFIADLVANPALTSLIATIDEVPHRLSRGIPLVERLVLLSRMPAFAGTSTQALANLAQSATERTFATGEVVAQAGGSTNIVTLLVEGSLELEFPTARVERRTRGLAAHLEELATGPRIATVTCLTDAVVLQLERDDLIDRIEEHFDLAMTLLAFVATEQERINDTAGSRCRMA